MRVTHRLSRDDTCVDDEKIVRIPNFAVHVDDTRGRAGRDTRTKEISFGSSM